MQYTVNEVMYQPEAQKWFQAEYFKVFNKNVSCSTCPQVLYREYFKLKKAIENPETMAETSSNFVLKAGAQISIPSKGVTLSEAHAPEEYCIYVLLANFEHFSKKFKHINMEVLEAAKKEAGKPAKKEKAEVKTEGPTIDGGEAEAEKTDALANGEPKENENADKKEVKEPAKRGRKKAGK